MKMYQLREIFLKDGVTNITFPDDNEDEHGGNHIECGIQEVFGNQEAVSPICWKQKSDPGNLSVN